MPTYSYKCKTCGKQQDKFNRIADHKNGPECCGAIMVQILTTAYVHGDFEPYVDHNIGPDPVVVKSKQHRRQLMKQNNVDEKVGKGWV